MRSPALVVLLALTGAGCATKADVQTLESSLAQDFAELRDDQRELLVQLQVAVDSLDAANARRASMEQGEIERRVTRLEDALAEVLEVVSQNNQLLNDLYARRSTGMAGPGQGAGPGRPSTDPGFTPPRGGADAASQFYTLALNQYGEGLYGTARQGFQEFLAQWPDHELAPDAQYYVARTYQEEGDVGQALNEYQRVTEVYPDSNRAPAALLQRGKIQVARQNTALARQLFTQILSGYPNSPEVGEAQRELQRLPR